MNDGENTRQLFVMSVKTVVDDGGDRRVSIQAATLPLKKLSFNSNVLPWQDETQSLKERNNSFST